jgi:2'-5' RNA ligase
MTSARKYSLWLMPTGELLASLAEIIEELSRNRPELRFEPHVTLLGGLSGLEPQFSSKTCELASLVEPYQIQIDKVDYLDEFFRSLFIRVEPTRPVLDANRKARLIFQRQQETEYLPHLSLMYGDLPPPTKEQIISRIGREFQRQFEVCVIHLYSTEGEPKDWHRVEEFPLR